jgi:hypothetical protein
MIGIGVVRFFRSDAMDSDATANAGLEFGAPPGNLRLGNLFRWLFQSSHCRLGHGNPFFVFRNFEMLCSSS